MAFCPNCGANIPDGAPFCSNCGVQFAAQQQQYQQAYQQSTDPFDHTAEFDPKDISENKTYCMLIYLMGAIGIIIALLARTSSPYVDFHLRQGLKLMITNLLLSAVAVILCFTFIVPIAATILIFVLAIIRIICFFQVCSNKAKEPAIVRGLEFLK